MPRTGKKIIADIFAPESNDPNAANSSFKLIDKDILELQTYPKEFDANNPLVQEAMRFIEDFSMRKSTLSAGPSGSVYMSDQGHFRIDFLDKIVDRQKMVAPDPTKPDELVPNPNFGRELSTPARISQDRGVIEVSKARFLDITVPESVAILGHEVRHFYFNDVQEDEQEADLGALKMFLGSGYGPIDAQNAFLGVFEKSPSDENRERYELINNFILDFVERNHKYNLISK